MTPLPDLKVDHKYTRQVEQDITWRNDWYVGEEMHYPTAPNTINE